MEFGVVTPEVVEDAAKWLDTRLPGWAINVNLDRFLMIQGDHCISGQNGMPMFTWCTWTEDYGEYCGTQYDDLFAAYDEWWRKEIEKRQLAYVS